MDDESGESMEPTEKVPLIQLGEAELENFMKSMHNTPFDAVPALEFSSVQFSCCEHVKYLKTSLSISIFVNLPTQELDKNRRRSCLNGSEPTH